MVRAQGYQAGIADHGRHGDVIKRNDIGGLGYTPPGTASAALFDIDVTFDDQSEGRRQHVLLQPVAGTWTRILSGIDGDGHARP